MRHFEVVKDKHRKNGGEVKLPTRATKNSIAYDFYSPIDLVIEPNQIGKIWTDVKAYMKGDHGYTVIDTNRSNLPNILYVGSSFTNILEALSIPSFNKMVSIDYRHNKSGNSINYYVEKYDIDYVVFVPSQSNDAFSSSMIKTHLGL